MATNQTKADNFIREMTATEVKIREKYGIDPKDITVSIRIKVEQYATYSSHEDED